MSDFFIDFIIFLYNTIIVTAVIIIIMIFIICFSPLVTFISSFKNSLLTVNISVAIRQYVF